MANLDKKLMDANANNTTQKEVVQAEFEGMWEAAMGQPKSEDEQDKEKKQELRMLQCH